jgi:hypothetical protein
MKVKCLCWNCGREIYSTESVHEINEELWCDECASSLFNDVPDCNYDEESV